MRILFIILITYIFSSGCAVAQPQPNTGTNNKKAKAAFEEAVTRYTYREYEEALKKVEFALSKDDNYIDAWDLKQDILYKMGKSAEAYQAALKCIQINSQYSKGYLVLAELCLNIGKYKECEENATRFLTFQSIPDNRKRYAENLKYKASFCIDQMNHPVEFKPINLGPGINSPNKDYAPSITVDNRKLIFSRSIQGQEDFYISIKKGSDWEAATRPQYPLNTPENESFPSFTADGRYVFFARFQPNQPGNCDIWMAMFNGIGFDEPIPLPPPVNSRGWESQPCISADGSRLYFIAERQGGMGGSDIYISQYSQGKWSEPKNLGAAVNSPGDEEAPFIHADGKTFYFSSDGRPGMGRFDLYKSSILEDGSLSEAVGLGYPINTSGDERWLTVSSNGTDAYMVSDAIPGGLGDWDIYKFALPAQVRPIPVGYVKGRVLDADTKQPVRARVEVTDLNSGKVTYLTISDKLSGEMLACLVSGGQYAFNITEKGYMPLSESFFVTTSSAIDSPVIRDFYIQPLKKGGKFVLKNIYFETGKFDLKPESHAELDKLADILIKNTSIMLEVGGHTDNEGSKESNQVLSDNRSKSVMTYLISKGVPASRLTSKGYGQNQPVAPNNTADGRAMNRRTEFTVTGL